MRGSNLCGSRQPAMSGLKRMTVCIVLTAGVLAGGAWLWRELRRAPLLPPNRDADGHPLADLPKELQAELVRQKPWEGRN